MRKKLLSKQKNERTNVRLFFEMSGTSKTKGIGSWTAESTLRRLTGEEDRLFEATFFFGVLTSSVLMISAPLRLTEWTSFSSRTWPFGTIFFGFDDVDIVGTV